MARQPADKNFSTRIPVLVKVDMTTSTPKVIWAHEKPLLEEVHGEGNVTEITVDRMDEGYTEKVSPALLVHNKKQDRTLPPSQTLGIGFVFLGTPEAEYARLSDAYGKHPDIDMTVVEKVYGRLQTGPFRDLLKRPRLQDLPDAQLRVLIGDFGYPADISKDSTQEEKREHADKVRGLREMTTDSLLELAKEVGVEI